MTDEAADGACRWARLGIVPSKRKRTYPGVDHFDIYDGPEHELMVADEVEFLRRVPGLAVSAV